MKTERLEEFVVLADTLNYSRAAEKLYISQPILSRHIKELEMELDCTLFVRDTHCVALTNEGKYFLRWVRSFLEKTDRALSSVSSAQSIGKGNVKILCSEQCLTTHILAFFRSFMQNYPEIKLQVISLVTGSKREMIYTADLFFTPCDYISMLHRDAQGFQLKAQQPLLAIPPYHHFGDLQEIRLEDLKGEHLLVPYAGEMRGPYARNALIAGRKCHGLLHKIKVENPQSGLLQVELGAGVMLIPHHLKHRAYPQTRTIPVTDHDCLFPIFVYLNGSAGNPAAQVFLDELQRNFSD